jgi:predicted cation transporter
MRPNRRSALLKLSVLLEFANHAAMGVALGLAFSLISIVIPAFGVGALIAMGSNPHDVMLRFVGTCALMFGVGAALTAIAFKVTEQS